MVYGKFAEVVLDIPLNKKFHYRIPPSFVDQIEIGKRVRVPFGRRTIIGYCVGSTDVPDVEKTKDILQVIDTKPVLSSGMLEIAAWMADFYFCGWGEALEALLPSVVKKGHNAKTINIARLSKNGDAIKETITELKRRAPRQAKALETLTEVDEIAVSELIYLSKCNMNSIYKLRDKGLINLNRKQVDDSIFTGKQIEKTCHLQPNKEQEEAINLINKKLRDREHSTILLKGVTGSGKTEVYLQAISEAIALGLRAIVLVPEIALTPQTIERFKSRFDKVAVLHSRLTGRQRNNQWWEIRNGKADVVIGARSAVFAPLENLGLIVIDEEHENTFKQDSAPRYNARDVSIMRAQNENAVVVLGSATPSLESYHNAVIGKYDFVDLPNRIGNKPLPLVEVVDMRHETYRNKNILHLSRYLELSIRRHLSNSGQILLFLNRRGFSSFINCKRCGFVLRCNSCDISLTYHKKQGAAICHYCNSEIPIPETCPECLSPGIKYFGFGTERVEEVLKAVFPEYTILRMDSDTMRGRDSHEKALSAFKRGDVDILLGTQMIAKGLDFPNVMLVGVLTADTIINLPDFRASERTFQLLSQVAGRTGRGDREGQVIIQTYNPDHYSVTCAVSHDYESFAKKELEYRKQLYYPPYGRLARILLSSEKDEDVKEASIAVAKKLRDVVSSHAGTLRPGGHKMRVEVLGPAPAPITRIKDKYRWHLIVRANILEDLQTVLKDFESGSKKSKKVRIIIDVDPFMLL